MTNRFLDFGALLTFFFFRCRYTKDILVGYCTVYKYELNENSFRKRISQFLIIPTHQKLKLGTEFLRVIYDQLLQETSTHEITGKCNFVLF